MECRETDLKGYLGYQRLERVQSDDRLVAIHGLMQSNQEWQTPFNSPDMLAHPHALYATIAPLIKFADTFFPGELQMRGSMVRHAVMAAMDFDEARTRTNAGFYNSRHSRVGTFLRFYVLPQIMEDLARVGQNSPQVAERVRLFLPGPDYDIILPAVPEKKDKACLSNHEKFFQFMPNVILPLLCDTIATGVHIKRSGTFNKIIADIAKDLKKRKIKKTEKPSLYTPQDPHVEVLQDLPPNWIFAASVGVPVDIPPIREEDYTRHMNGYNPYDLVICAKKFIARNAIEVLAIEICADLRQDKKEPISDSTIYPIATVEFNPRLPAEIANQIDGRSGAAVSTFDNAHVPIKITDRIIAPDNLILHYGEDGEYIEDIPFVLLDLSAETRNVFRNHINLGPDWEKRYPADTLDLAVRTIWQAIDAEIQGWHSETDGRMIKDETLARIAQHLAKLEEQDPEVWDKMPAYQRTCIQNNLLNAMVVSPNRFLEYFDQAGIWKILFRNIGLPPTWQHALSLMFNKGYVTQPDYRDQVLGDRHTLKSHEFINGWYIIDKILNLQNVYPDATYIERIYRFTSI